VIWECGRVQAAAIPVPVASDKLVFSMTGYPMTSRTLFAIPIDSTGDITDQDKIAWSRDRGTPYVPSPVLVGDTLYFTSGNTGMLSSANASTGEPIIDQKRVKGLRNVYASPVAAAGRIYITGRDGKTVVIKDGPELEILATNQLDDRIDASAAIVGDELFMRGKKYLYCIAK
jgi:outer membrane protein assembly factor BamB